MSGRTPAPVWCPPRLKASYNGELSQFVRETMSRPAGPEKEMLLVLEKSTRLPPAARRALEEAAEQPLQTLGHKKAADRIRAVLSRG